MLFQVSRRVLGRNFWHSAYVPPLSDLPRSPVEHRRRRCGPETALAGEPMSGVYLAPFCRGVPKGLFSESPAAPRRLAPWPAGSPLRMRSSPLCTPRIAPTVWAPYLVVALPGVSVSRSHTRRPQTCQLRQEYRSSVIHLYIFCHAI